MAAFQASLMRAVLVVLFALAAALLWKSASADEKGSILVAVPELQGPYAKTVILCIAMGEGHVGVILNRPTEMTLSQAFPEHEPSKRVTSPIYLGGPQMAGAIFTLTIGEKPDETAKALLPGVWIVSDGAAVDRLIENSPNAQRYYAGFVGWRPGELEAELKQGMFKQIPLDHGKLERPETGNLWEELTAKGTGV